MISLPHVITSEELWKIIDQTQMPQEIAKHNCTWIGHIVLSKQNIELEVQDWNPLGRRERSRQEKKEMETSNTRRTYRNLQNLERNNATKFYTGKTKRYFMKPTTYRLNIIHTQYQTATGIYSC